ncbi:CDP-glycerol glycerophosphotransferase family protein [Chitiniphilus purpureus]|uniref:CDP-glycerol glycerophosphotransferase family protein n=1 Tax=Chitiniphilus purpureus TaxID=2981137 RepID=A0ABY6DJ42_9NEIS|nr:CDP-glycerol glycerophosphotransferase family protein [Chitiniphilus sp. CD1]UXY13703.1 CDP-glycerol glycerophosphotransferase family protein [Chitiniphilus sp. CD1]
MPRDVLCYCYHVSHVLNLGRIPALLAERGARVRWFNAFPESAFPLERAPGVEYAFDVPLQALGGQEADLYLTPFVGQSAHFPQRARRVHFLVSLTGLDGVYDKAMFDHYDVIACAGRHHIDDFTALARERGWQHKVLMPLGYPKLDGQRRQLAGSGLRAPDKLTVVFAPTHAYYINQGFSILNRYGEQLIAAMLDDGISVVFRPHMESWRDQDRPVVERIVARFQAHPDFALDRSGNYFDTYAQTHMMLTDISGTGFTYAFTFGRPALFFAPNAADEAGLRGIQFERRENIGLVVRSIDELVARLRLAQTHSDFLQRQIAEFRDWLLFNPGGSETFFAEHAHALLSAQGAAPDWPHLHHPV